METCPDCGKPRPICVCDRVVALPTRVEVLVLQHPQEQDVELGTVPLLARSLPRCTVRVGLSWANLEQAVGHPVDPARWVVLRPTDRPADLPPALREAPVVLLDAKERLRGAKAPPIEGLVALDGTWSQAKTLWWRNPWLVRLGRVCLEPREASMYGKLRKEPRRQWVSTLEAVADVLPALGEDEEVRASLRRLLRTMLQRARDAQKTAD